MANYSKSIRHYASFYRLVVCAVIVMMAVLTGSLVMGSSVRGTLTDRVHERLGDTETIISSGTGFLCDSIMRHPLFADAKGYLLCEGFVSSGERLLPVMVWSSDEDYVAPGTALVNEPLQSQLAADLQDFSNIALSQSGESPALVLHLPSHSLVPSGSLFVTQRYSTQIRLSVTGVRTVAEGGNRLLHNEQALPLNIFVNRHELAEAMDLDGKLNLVMCPQYITEELLADVWSPALSSININGDRITSDRIFIPQSVVDTLQPQRICFAYLANDIVCGSDSLAYPFVTATNHWRGERLCGNDMLLSDYAAKRINAAVGDTLSMEYFVIKGMKRLETRTRTFRVKGIVPLAELKADSLLMTEYPGLSNVERCTDWDSDLPIDMSHITREDEDYWYTHRQTPKALVSYEAVQDDWSTSFGVATALSVHHASEAVQRLSLAQMGGAVNHPVEASLLAAQSGTDFASLFLALGFFIILSGVLLMQTPLVEMLNQRRSELALYSAMGYTDRRILRLLGQEIGIVILCASPLGIIAGLLYAGTALYLLGNVWSGATHTEGLALHISLSTIAISWVVGMTICCATVWWALRTVTHHRQHQTHDAITIPLASQSTITGQRNNKRVKSLLPHILLLTLTFILIVCNLFLQSILLFVLCGLLWLISSGMLLMAFVSNRASSASLTLHTSVWKSLHAQRHSLLLSFWSLAVGVFTVFAVGLNRPDFSHSVSDRLSTGGFSLWCESRVPVEYDLNDPQVRRKLLLNDLPDCTYFMQLYQHTEDEASCMNLNRVTTPTILGVEPAALSELFGYDVAPLMQHSDSVYPILMDSESLTWSMMRSVGDTIDYPGSGGSTIRLVIAGTYPTGIFHGKALMHRDLFRQLWSDETGSRLMLVGTPKGKEEEARTLIETALSEYGWNISTTTERLQLFFSVTDTYLAIFLTLGGMGLLLGIVCLIITVRKNLAARRSELDTLSALGYSPQRIRLILLRENLTVPLCAILTGAIGSLISISANVGGAGTGTLLTAAIFLTLLLLLAWYGIRSLIKQ